MCSLGPARVWALQLKLNDDTFFNSGMLTAPLALQNSRLLVCVVSSQHSVPASLLDWSVGSDSWSEMQLGNSLIEQIVEFNGQFIAMDSYYRLYTVLGRGGGSCMARFRGRHT